MTSAQDIFSEDPDLIRMLGTYYLRVNEVCKALSTFTKLIEVAAHEIDGYINRANIFMEMGRIKEAFNDYQTALTG